MKDVLLLGTADEMFDRAVGLARRLAESSGARLHVLYVVDEPLSAGWTAEISAARLPELHQAIEDEARERLSRLIPEEQQADLGIEIAIRTGRAPEELVRYTEEQPIDLAIVLSSDQAGRLAAQALLDDSRSAVLALR